MERMPGARRPEERKAGVCVGTFTVGNVPWEDGLRDCGAYGIPVRVCGGTMMLVAASYDERT